MNFNNDEIYEFKFLRKINDILDLGVYEGKEFAYKSCLTTDSIKENDKVYIIFKKIDRSGNPLLFQLPKKYIMGNEYYLKYSRNKENSNSVVIGLDELGNEFEITKNYSCISPFRVNQELKCLPNLSNGTQRFYICEYFFIDLKTFFKQKEIDFISKDYSIDYELFYQFKKQYKEENNLWILSLSTYIIKAIPNFLYRNLYEDAIFSIEISKKLQKFIEYAIKAGGLGPYRIFEKGHLKKQRTIEYYENLSSFFKKGYTISELKSPKILVENFEIFKTVLITSEFELISKEDIIEILSKIRESPDQIIYINHLKFIKDFCIKKYKNELSAIFKSLYVESDDKLNYVNKIFTQNDIRLIELISSIDESYGSFNTKKIIQILKSENLETIKKELSLLSRIYFENKVFNNKKVSDDLYLINDLYNYNNHYITYYEDKIIIIANYDENIIKNSFYINVREEFKYENFIIGYVYENDKKIIDNELKVYNLKYDFDSMYFSFYTLESLMYLSKNIDERNRIVNIANYIGRIIRSPKTYLLSTINSLFYHMMKIEYFETYEVFEKINQKLKDEKIEKYFPSVKKIQKTLSLFKNINKNDSDNLMELIKSDDKVIRNTAKKILIYNLIGDDNIGLNKKDILKNMFGYFSKINKQENKEELITKDQSNQILKLIEKGEIMEDKYFEFKETLICPVLNKSQQLRIHNIKRNNNLEEDKKDEVINKILSEINKNDKSSQREVFHSTFKNICAMLNAEGGHIVIGLRDVPSKISQDSNLLVGIQEDYNLIGGWDEILLYFDSQLKTKMIDYSKFDKFIKIEKVNYKEKDFILIKIEIPIGIKDPCIIINSKNEEVCYKKLNASCEPMTMSEIRKFKREQPVVRMEKTYVYMAINSDGQTKLGITNNINSRESALRTSDPTIKLDHSYLFKSRIQAKNIEDFLIKKYQKFNIGRDWFNLDKDERLECFNIIKEQYQIHGAGELDLFSTN